MPPGGWDRTLLLLYCVTALPSSLARLSLRPRTLPRSDIEGRTAAQAAAWCDVGSLEPVLLPKARETERAAKVHRRTLASIGETASRHPFV